MEIEKLHQCSHCLYVGTEYDTRNVFMNIGGFKAEVKNVTGYFCEKCNNIDFDENTDSAYLIAETGDNVIIQKRATSTDIN